MNYWVYENWVAESKAVIHAGECALCNDGAGTGRNTQGTLNGKWHGPFESPDRAEIGAHQTGRPVRRHSCVQIGDAVAAGSATSGEELSVSADAAKPTSSSIPELADFGFKPAGAWSLDPTAKGGVRFSLFAYRNDRSVYAFAVNGRAEYIGICDSSATTLGSRMSRYQNMVGAGTNARIVKLIKAAIEGGAEVLIYAMIPAPGPSHSDLDVDFVKGLEFPLIAKLKPSWNRHH
jgi:hypothetical protein